MKLCLKDRVAIKEEKNSLIPLMSGINPASLPCRGYFCCALRRFEMRLVDKLFRFGAVTSDIESTRTDAT